MKGKLALLILALGLAGCAAQKAPAPNPLKKDWTITVTFNYDFTNFPVCSTTVTKGCISGFTWGYLQGGTPVPLKTSAASICTGTTQPEVCTDSTNALLGIGNVTPYAIANGVDNNGNAVSSAQALGPVDTIAIGVATNVTWTRK